MILSSTVLGRGETSNVSPEKTLSFELKGVEFKMIPIEGGSFVMGADSPDAPNDQKPAHKVTLSDYYMGQTEVTQELWTVVMGNNPASFRGKNLPVEDVSWEDCQKFITSLNNMLQKEGKLPDGMIFHLPSEAQWEYAARGGNKSKGYKYAGSDDINAVAWTRSNAGGRTHPVAGKLPNELGLYDMSGNVWEWVQDYAAPYSEAEQTNPVGHAKNTGRVIKRGGSWYYSAEERFTPAFRYAYGASLHDYSIGMRLCLSFCKK